MVRASSQKVIVQITKPLLATIMCVTLASCSGGSGGSSKICTSTEELPDPKYTANVVSTDTDTFIVISQFIDNGDGSFSVVELQTVSLGYGLMPFFTGNGSVPSSQLGLPDKCYSSSNLDIASAPDCWIDPTNDLLTSSLTSLGINNSEQVAVTMQYAIDSGDDTVDLSALQGLTQGLSSNLGSDCFNSSMPTETVLE